MSGGAFDYDQYKIGEIADSIEGILNKQGTLKPKEDLWGCGDYYEKYPEEKFYHTYPPEIQEKFKNGIKFLRIAAIYAQRIDWFLSGDDGEESFIERLCEELNTLK